MKQILLPLLIFLSFAGFAQSIGTGQIKDGAVTEPKLADNALRPVDSGVLSDFALVFGTEYRKKYSLTVTTDIALSLSGSTQTADSYIFITTIPNGTNVVSFPEDWAIKNNAAFDPTTTQRIELYYDGINVYVDIFNADPIVLSELLTAEITGGTDDLNLTFDNAVTITTSGWTLTASGGAVTVSSVVSGTGTTAVVLDLSRNITAGEDVTLSYDPTTGNTVSSTGNELPIISNRFVDTGDEPPVDFCDITVCASGCDYTTGQAGSDAAVSGQTVCFGAGTYRETIVGKTGVTYRNIPGETAIISGLTDVGSSGWTVHSGSIYKKTVTLPVSNNISSATLTSTSTIVANQVFKDGTMMILARWPNVSTPSGLLDRSNMRHYSQTQGLTNTQVTDSGLPATANLAGSHIFIGGWFFSQTRVITARSGNTITYPATDPYPNFTKHYYITNHIDLLSQAGEWFYAGGILYFWQTGGGSPTGVEFKARNWGFDLRGKSNVTIEGLHFIGCEPMTGDHATSNNIIIDNIRATYTNHAFTQIDPDLIYRSAYMHGMKLGSNCIIRNSEFNYCASQLIWAGTNSIITNNLASNISYEGNYGAFVTPSYLTDGAQITYNTVSRVGRSHVDFGPDGNAGGDHQGHHYNMEIGYNIFSEYLMLNVDGGSVYGARGINLTGTVVHHNWIYDNTVGDQWIAIPADWHGIHVGIYYDQGSGPTTNHHNVLWESSVVDSYNQIYFGRQSKWYNNTFAGVSPATRESYVTYQTETFDLLRNNIFQKYVNILHGSSLGDIKYNLLSTSNSTQPAGNFNVVNNNAQFVGSGSLGLAYRIQTGSPAKDIGTPIAGITDGYIGSAPDAGAYEFGGEEWVPGYDAAAVGGDYIIDNEDVAYTGAAWTHSAGNPWNLGPTFSISYSPTSGAYFEGSFTGTEVKLYSEERFNHGIIEIKIDGVRVDCDPVTGGTQDCDLYDARTDNNVTLIGTWATAAGTHTFRATKVGENPSCTSGCNIIFDYLEVTP